ncbi:MAG: sugar ABC transporter permease [Planctomycetes bacterium]|nr:sugar ABC transporter permease [Planctomycetota bacterium]
MTTERRSTGPRRHNPDSLTTGVLWISPWILGFVCFLAVPIGLSVYYSFTDYSLLDPPEFVGWDNFRALMHDALFWRAIRNTAFYAAVTVPGGLVLSLALALLLTPRTRTARFARAAVFLPTLVPPVAIAMGWMWLFNPRQGLINAVLRSLGFDGPDWLGDARWAMWAMVLMTMWGVGGAVVIYLAAIQDVPRSLYEAAELDGASRARRAWHVTLPMISPAILFNVVVGLIGSLQMFALPQIMTRGGPDFATYMYTQHVYANAFIFGRMGYASAAAWIQILIIAGLTVTVLGASRRLVFSRGA